MPIRAGQVANVLGRGCAMFALVTLCGAVIGVVLLGASAKPSLDPAGGYSVAVLDRDGALLRLHLAGDERYRLYTPLSDIAPDAVRATLLYEDRHFRRHPGVNPVALVRAAWQTYVAGDRPVGASTITMQLARLRFGLRTRSVSGKLVQVARALQFEWHYSKDEILEAYLNVAPYGGNVEGIGAAARVYFDKTPGELSLAEALALAVVPQNPVARHPGREARGALDAARERLADRFALRHGLTPEARARVALPLAARAPRQLPFHAPHTAQRARGQSASAERTTLDLKTQHKTEEVVARYLQRAGHRGLDNASVLVVDHRSMDVLAAVGSAGFFNARVQGQVDGTRAKRSPGSTLKPLLYAMALDDGLIHPMSLLKDAPIRYAAYAPENFDRGFLGPVTATDALNLSRNVPAIELLQRVGHARFNALLTAGGVADLHAADHYGLAMILGGNELTLRELAGLYAMLANGGRWRPLRDVFTEAPQKGERLLSAEASFLVLDMLRQHARPDRASSVSGSIAWKTGTSYGFRDAWTVGVAGPYVVGVWVGHFDGRGHPALVGREAAAPLFFELLDALDVGSDEVVPPPGLNVRRVDVCAATGDLPGPHCPRTASAWFIPGVSPIRVSTVHRALRVHTPSGLRACRTGPDTHEAVYEFWPSDIERVFARAGVSLRTPPPWHPECDLATRQVQGKPPHIKTPVAHLTYQLRGHDDDVVPLTAATDSDARWLYWFANGDLIAEGPRDSPMFWRPHVGVHDVAVVDDLGRSQSRRVKVAQAPAR